MQFAKRHHARFGWQMPQKLDAQNIESFLGYYHSALLSYDQEYIHTMNGDRYPTFSPLHQKTFILLRSKAAEQHSYPHVSPVDPWVSPWNEHIRSQPPKVAPPTMEIDISPSGKENERHTQGTPQRSVEFKDPGLEADGTNTPHVSNPSVSVQHEPDNTEDVEDQSTDSESDEVVVPRLTREVVSICTTDEERTDPLDCLPPRGTPPDTKRYLGRAERSGLSQPQAQATDLPNRESTPLQRMRIPKKQEAPTPNSNTSYVFQPQVLNLLFHNKKDTYLNVAEQTNQMIISRSQRNLSISEFFDPSRTFCPGPGRPHEYFT